MKLTKTCIAVISVALFLLVFPFVVSYEVIFNLVEIDLIAVICWIALGILIIATWYWKVLQCLSLNVVAKLIILIVALFLLLFPFTAAFLRLEFFGAIWFWAALGILIIFTWSQKKGSEKNIMEAEQ
jgi:hypothetical protein